MAVEKFSPVCCKKKNKRLFSTPVLANVEQSNNEVVFLNDGEIVLSFAVEELKPHTKKREFHVLFFFVKHLSGFFAP